MKAVLAAARRVPPTDTTVLLLGESGTGKSQLARYIHYAARSGAAAPLVELHCAALPESLLESRALRAREGRLHRRDGAQGGPPRPRRRRDAVPRRDRRGERSTTQVKLLRFLQERDVRPARVDADSEGRRAGRSRRPIATSRSAVEGGALPRGLLLPAERLQHLGAAAARAPRRHPARSPSASSQRAGCRRRSCRPEPASGSSPTGWPGNVRELENALERALILAGEDEIQARITCGLGGPARAAARPRRPARRGLRPRTPSSGSSSWPRWSAPAGTRPRRRGCWASPAAASIPCSRAMERPRRGDTRPG